MPTPMQELLDIMARLRDPDAGCPWDIEQNFKTIAPHTIEEAYEVADAIEHDDMASLRDELGDLLFQVVFHSQMARELGHFSFNDVVISIKDKMLRRHPHVFGEEKIETAEAQTLAWENLKAQERLEKIDGTNNNAPSALDGVTKGLPALMRAYKLQKRAERVGFDWQNAKDVVDKIYEEATELRVEMEGNAPKSRLMDELGDLLFSCVNLARKLDIDPESALRHGNAKFEHRFKRLETTLRDQGISVEDASPETLDQAWNHAKEENNSEK